MLLGGEPLDILEQWVKELFLAVPSGRGPRPAFDHLGRPYTVWNSFWKPLDIQIFLSCVQEL